MSSLALGLILLIFLVETIVGFGVNNRYNGYLTVLCSHQGTLPNYGNTVMSASEDVFQHYARTNQNELRNKGRKRRYICRRSRSK